MFEVFRKKRTFVNQKYFTSNFFFGHVECSFDNTAQVFFHKKMEIVSLNVHKGYIFLTNCFLQTDSKETTNALLTTLVGKIRQIAEIFCSLSGSYKSTFLGKRYAFALIFSYVCVELSFDEPVPKIERRSRNFSAQCPKLRKKISSKNVICRRMFLWTPRRQFW